MATIYIDNTAYEVNERQNLLHQCLSLGFDLPYFCWHPALGSVGCCRQCAIKQYQDENDAQGRIVMACMVPAQDGTRISIDDQEAADFRRTVVEWLMINHPHDCPVCEEGGECHLQDMTLMTGHVYRRYRFQKRTFRNQYLGPFINHEMNRCITCYRCVRFYSDYAGGSDLRALGMHNHVYFGRHRDGVLENEFSGNLVEVCPTGVFTDKTLGDAYTRKWDLQSAPSVCVHCSVGCNTNPNERYGKLRRIVNRYNGAVNGYFICDRGRFGYGFVNSDKRIRTVRLPRADGANAVPSAKAAARKRLRDLLASSRRVMGIGSPRASVEANFTLRTLVGSEHFYSGMSERDGNLVRLVLGIFKRGPARPASLHDVEQADAVLVLGEDLTNTAPRIALSLRQAVRNKTFDMAQAQGVPWWQDSSVRDAAQKVQSPLIVVSPDATRLDDAATQTYRAAPDDIARLGLAIAHELDHDAPRVADLADESQRLARHIAGVLKDAKRPLVVSGIGCRSEAVIRAAANVAWALCHGERAADLCLTVPECNSIGLGMMAAAEPLSEALEVLRGGATDTLIVLENDLYRRADRAAVDEALAAARHVVVLDHLATETVDHAQLALPAGTFAEADGTLVNYEGRAQRFFQVMEAGGDVEPSWRWLAEAMGKAWSSLDDVIAACVDELAVFKGVEDAAPPAGFRIWGTKIPRAPHRYSGRTAMHAHISIHEPKPTDDHDAPMSFSMEGYHGLKAHPPAAIPFFWAPRWNSNEALNKFQDEVAGPLRGGNPGVRLSEPQEIHQGGYFNIVPPAFKPDAHRWLVVPLHHIFGGEELSVEAPALAERVPAPYLALNPADAARIRVKAGDPVEIRLDTGSQRLPVEVHPGLAAGVAGLPFGLPGLDYSDLPSWGRIEAMTT